MIPRFLLRMSRWARNPPSERRVALLLGVLAACLVIAALNWAGLWPDALTLSPRNGMPRIHAAP